MSKRNEFTDEEVTRYVEYLHGQRKKHEIEAAKQRRHLERIDLKIANPETSLRKDVKEKTMGVLKAIGRDASGASRSKKSSSSAAPIDPPTVEMPLGQVDEVRDPVKKSSWGW